MIDPKHLRIGNYLFYDCQMYEGQEPKIVKINTITENWILDDKNKNSILGNLESYKPIKINKEILLKFGFDWNEGFPYLNVEILKDHFFGFQDNSIVLFTDFEYQQISKKIKHVHEFQNIYFSLTGKEIEIEI